MYNNEINEILKEAEKCMLDLKHPYVGTEHLFISLLKNNKEIKELLNNNGIFYKEFKKSLIDIMGIGYEKQSKILYTPLLKKILNTSYKKYKQNITPENLLTIMLEENEGIAIRLLINQNVDINSLYNDLKEINKSLDELNKVGINLNELNNNKDIIIERENEIENVIEILSKKNKCNPLLIGEAGVGKTALVEELAKRIKNGKVPKELLNKIIYSVNMGALLSGTKYRGEFEERLNNIIKEVRINSNIILFIDEIHTIIKAGGSEGSIDASNILKPFLARGEVKCIGATTLNEYRLTIKKDKALDRRFEIVYVNEPSLNQTLNILKINKKIYEDHYNLKISIKNINDIVELTNTYIKNKYNPDKSLNILELACSKSKNQNIKITRNFIEMLIKDRLNIQTINPFTNDSVSQELVDKIRSKAKNKVLAINIFGNDEKEKLNIINHIIYNNKLIIDGSLFNSEYSLNKLLGDPYYINSESLFDYIKSNPSTIIYIKNFDSSCNYFKLVIDKIIESNVLIDNKMELIDFSNSIFILSKEKNNAIGFNNKTSNNIYYDNYVSN